MTGPSSVLMLKTVPRVTGFLTCAEKWYLCDRDFEAEGQIPPVSTSVRIR